MPSIDQERRLSLQAADEITRKPYYDPQNRLATPVPDVDFSGLKTTGDRAYNSDFISYIDKLLRKSRMSSEKRASILANIVEESGGDPFAVDDTGNFRGLLQWSEDRYPAPTGTEPYGEIDNQVRHIIATQDNTTDQKSWTHGGDGTGYNSYKDAIADFNSPDLATAMRGYTLGHVRPTGKIDSYNNRLKVAQQIYNLKGFRR